MLINKDPYPFFDVRKLSLLDDAIVGIETLHKLAAIIVLERIGVDP